MMGKENYAVVWIEDVSSENGILELSESYEWKDCQTYEGCKKTLLGVGLSLNIAQQLICQKMDEYMHIFSAWVRQQEKAFYSDLSLAKSEDGRMCFIAGDSLFEIIKSDEIDAL